MAVMPKRTTVISAESCGVSNWCRAAKVSVILPDGSPKRYFLKVSKHDSSVPCASGAKLTADFV
jgi:hypothetical protein